jgi:hypothetical protein
MMIHIGRKAPKGFREINAMHIGHGVWLILCEPIEDQIVKLSMDFVKVAAPTGDRCFKLSKKGKAELKRILVFPGNGKKSSTSPTPKRNLAP